MKNFVSTFKKLCSTEFPSFSKTRIMMMPVILGKMRTIPEGLSHYRPLIHSLFEAQDYEGEIGYLTIDEKVLEPGQTHRRSGIHVDGIYKSSPGGWGGGGSWGGGFGHSSNEGTGFLTVSSHAQCKAWKQEFTGRPGDEGECEHLAEQCQEDCAELFNPGQVYWANPLCVHESLPAKQTVMRQFVRLSLPSSAPWFEGYTENPLGVKPSGPILPRRKFMDL